MVDSTNYLCNCVNKANIKDVICEILEWGSRMWLRLKIIYLIISHSLSHPLSNLAMTYYMCPDSKFAIGEFRGSILKFIDARFINLFLALRSLVRWRGKLLISLLFHEKSTSVQRYVFGISLNLFTGKNGECCAICIKLSVCWIATLPNAFVCVQLEKDFIYYYAFWSRWIKSSWLMSDTSLRKTALVAGPSISTYGSLRHHCFISRLSGKKRNAIDWKIFAEYFANCHSCNSKKRFHSIFFFFK